MSKPQKTLALYGAILFAVGLAFGVWAGMGLSGMVSLRLPRLSLATHLNGLLGGLWLIAVASTFPHLKYGKIQLTRLSFLVGIPAFANVFITFAASLLGRNGLIYTGEGRNDAVAFALQFFVVLPSLVGTLYWIRGFLYKGASR